MPVGAWGPAGVLPPCPGTQPGTATPSIPAESGKHLSEILQAEVPLRRGKAIRLAGALCVPQARALPDQYLLHNALPLSSPGPGSRLLGAESIPGVPPGLILLPRRLGFGDWALQVCRRLPVQGELLQGGWRGHGWLGPGAEVLLLTGLGLLGLGGHDPVLAPQAVQASHHLVLVMQLQ